MEIKNEIKNILIEEAQNESELRKLEDTLYHHFAKAFQDKLRELPPPPVGYYYFPEFDHAELVGENYEVTMNITLKPIINGQQD